MHAHARIGYFGVIIAIVLLSCGILVSRSILDGFSRIEMQNLLGDVGWVILDLEGKGLELGFFASDLGTIPEAKRFFEEPTSNFMDDYLDSVTAEVMEFDFAAMLDRNLQCIAGVKYDSGPGGQDTLPSEYADILEKRLSSYGLERGMAHMDVIALDAVLYLVVSHLVYDFEDPDADAVGTIMIGSRLPTEEDVFEGALGTTYAQILRRQDSDWGGEGELLHRETVYPVFHEEMVPEYGEDYLEWEELDETDLPVHELVMDLGIFETTQYYRLEASEEGPDGLPKSVVMCSIGGVFSDSSVVMKIMVPQTISRLASRKADLVNLSLCLGVVWTIGFTWFSVREVRRRLVAENSLRKANGKLEVANAQKDRLFSIIGHDMRAPLNGVIRLSELMARAPGSFEPKEVARFATNINLTGKQLHGLLENLLHWARLQTGQLSFDAISLDLLTVIRQVVLLYRPRADAKRIEIDVDVMEGIIVLADVEMLKTILRNLVSNAIKFTGEGGAVSISVSVLEGFVRISVSDTGQGMSQGQLEALYKVKAKPNMKRGAEEDYGTGFGLLLCHEMVRRHQSELEVYSETGVGSEFSFSLPVASHAL